MITPTTRDKLFEEIEDTIDGMVNNTIDTYDFSFLRDEMRNDAEDIAYEKIDDYRGEVMDQIESKMDERVEEVLADMVSDEVACQLESTLEERVCDLIDQVNNGASVDALRREVDILNEQVALLLDTIKSLAPFFTIKADQARMIGGV